MFRSGNASRTLACAAAAAAMMLFANAAVALSTGEYVGKNEAEITESLKKQGYEVREVEKEGDVWEAEIVRDGKLWEISADPSTGRLIEVSDAEDAAEHDEKDGSLIKRLLSIGN